MKCILRCLGGTSSMHMQSHSVFYRACLSCTGDKVLDLFPWLVVLPYHKVYSSNPDMGGVPVTLNEYSTRSCRILLNSYPSLLEYRIVLLDGACQVSEIPVSVHDFFFILKVVIWQKWTIYTILGQTQQVRKGRFIFQCVSRSLCFYGTAMWF